MRDSTFLQWIRGRIVNVYGESPNVDFVRRIDEIIDRLRDEELAKAEK